MMSQELSKNRKLKPIWRQVGHDFKASISSMKDAMVVAFYTPKFPSTDKSYYGVSPRSYFPYTDEQLSMKFDNHYDCCEYAESIILKWVSSLFTSFEYDGISSDGYGIKLPVDDNDDVADITECDGEKFGGRY